MHFRREITEKERRRAEAEMYAGFHSMMDRYDEQKRQLKSREPWIANNKTPGNPPSVMTITHVNQTKDLYVCFEVTVLILFYELYQYVAKCLILNNSSNRTIRMTHSFSSHHF